MASPGSSYSVNSYFKFWDTNLHKMHDLLTVKMRALSRIPCPREGGGREGKKERGRERERERETKSRPCEKIPEAKGRL